MTNLELQDAIDLIEEAHTACETYYEQFQNDKAAMGLAQLMDNCIGLAKTLAQSIQSKIDGWCDAAAAIAEKEASEMRGLQREQSGV